MNVDKVILKPYRFAYSLCAEGLLIDRMCEDLEDSIWVEVWALIAPIIDSAVFGEWEIK